MSRIGRKPIEVPAGVEVKIEAGNVVTVKGALGTMTQALHSDMIIKKEGNEIIVERPSEMKEHKSLHGLTRTLLSNMVEGVTKGFSKTLDINGVGYRAAKAGKTLTLNLGYSHPVVFEEADGITLEVPNANQVIVKGIDKQKVGQMAAEIRSNDPFQEGSLVARTLICQRGGIVTKLNRGELVVVLTDGGKDAVAWEKSFPLVEQCLGSGTCPIAGAFRQLRTGFYTQAQRLGNGIHRFYGEVVAHFIKIVVAGILQSLCAVDRAVGLMLVCPFQTVGVEIAQYKLTLVLNDGLAVILAALEAGNQG